MKTLTEAQIRQVVRKELQQYLIEEGLMSDLSASKIGKRYLLPGVLLATMLTTVNPTSQGQAMGGDGGGGSQDTGQQVEDALTINDMLDQVGLKDKVLSELESNLTKEDKIKIQDLFKQMKDKQQEINNAKREEKSQDEIQKLETERNEIFSAKTITDPDQLERIINTGSAIFRFIENASPEELESIGDIDSEEALLKLQAKALRYTLSVEGRQQMVARGVQQDLITAKNALFASGFKQPNEKTVTNFFQVIVYYILEDLAQNNQTPQDVFGESITVIEALRYLIDKGIITEEDSELISNFDEEKYNIELEGIPSLNMTISDAMQMYSGSTKPIQENKVNKLRQRLNELRGVYV
jgi:hypothetical protein